MERKQPREPVALLPRVGGLATMPSRHESLMQALPYILPQIDRLYLYLDQHTEVPKDLLDQPKIVPILPEGKNLGSDGKFMGLKRETQPCLYFCFDDDIIYPPDYATRLMALLRRMNFAVVVGVHGNVFPSRIQSYTKSRSMVHFAGGLQLDALVDELGSGTLAFYSECIQIDPEIWAQPNLTDLMFMLEAIRQHVPRLCMRREPGYLRPIAEQQADSLHVKTLQDDTVQTQLLLAAIKAYPQSWCHSS
jgi:hypothetical protein